MRSPCSASRPRRDQQAVRNSPEGSRSDVPAGPIRYDVVSRCRLTPRPSSTPDQGLDYSERGLESGLQEFDTEDAACRYLLEQLRNDPTTHFHLVVGPLPAAEADSAFEAWKDRTGLVDIAQSDVKVDDPIFAHGPVRRYWVRGTLLPLR